jgi:hypothetical protein
VTGETGTVSRAAYAHNAPTKTQVDVQDLAAALFSLHGDDVESVKNSFFQRQVLSVSSTAASIELHSPVISGRVSMGN